MEIVEEVTIFKTPYEWCLQHNVRPYKPNLWSIQTGSFHWEKIDEIEFLKRLGEAEFKKNSVPRKMDEYLELRMYGLVIYQLMGIQQGIQFQHAVTDYQRNLPPVTTTGSGGYSAEITDLNNSYNWWADKWKTSIVLNGGTSNDSDQYTGTMQQHLKSLRDNDVHVTEFREPDLGNCLTAMCFMVDERVFNKDLYPEFKPTPKPWGESYEPNEQSVKNWEDENARNHEKWVEKVGGKENAFLREFLIGKRLA